MPDRESRAPYLDSMIDAAKEMRWVRVVYESAEQRSTQAIASVDASVRDVIQRLETAEREQVAVLGQRSPQPGPAGGGT